MMSKETIIDMVERHIEHCKKWEEGFSTFTLEACETILYYLKGQEDEEENG